MGYFGIPGVNDHTEGIKYQKPVKLDSSQGFEDLQLQFDSADNKTIFGQSKTVDQRVDDYQGMGPGRIVIKGKTNTDAGVFFYPDNKEYNVGTAKNLKDLESLQEIFSTVGGVGAGLTSAKPKPPNIVYQRNDLKVQVPLTREGGIDAKNLSRIIDDIIIKRTDTLQSKEAALQTRIGQFQAGGSKSTRDLGLTTEFAKTSTLKNTPDRIRDKILKNRINPTLEELEQATVGPGREGIVPKPTYVRPAKTPLVKRPNARKGIFDWTEIGTRLQKKHGGTDGQKEAFIRLQIAHKKALEQDIKDINKRMQFDYLEFANAAVGELDAIGYPVGSLTDNDIYSIYLKMASDPRNADILDEGHARSAKNIWRETPEGVATSADYVSNLRMEIRRSIRDWANEGALVESGNIRRGSREDAPRIVDILKGVSPNVDIEYVRFIDKDFERAFTAASVPFERHEHFTNYLKTRLKEWQGRGDDRLHGAQQLYQYRKKLNEWIDDYLNEQDLGEWELTDKVKGDFIDDLMRNTQPTHSLDLKNEKDVNRLLDAVIFKRINKGDIIE